MYDPDTGLIHFGFREYDPTIGRFISPDPLGYAGGDVDLYGYCLDDPINFVDRDGLKGRNGKEDDGESGAEDKKHSITGMDMRKERQALKEKAEKQSPESEAESSDAEKEEKGSLEKVYDGVSQAVTEGGKATLEAVSKAGETLQGEGDDYIKFGEYVSPKKRKIFNEMMKEAKAEATDRALDGAMNFGPAGLAEGMVGGSIGMLNGLIGAINDDKNSKNEASQKIEDNFRTQRQDIDKHIDNFKKQYRN